MAKRHKIPADRLVKIPHYLTPMRPRRGEFNHFTTPAPVTIWNVPTLRAVARRCFCAETKAQAIAELQRRGESVA